MFLIPKAEITDRSPWGDFWFSPVGNQTAAGVRVTPDSALQLTAVLASVRALSESFAILPVEFYRPDGRKRLKITNHWLYQLLAKTPNRYQNAYHWREMLQGHLALRGNAYCQIIEGRGGKIAELMPLNPDRISLDIFDDGNYRYRFQDRVGREIYFAKDEIWHLKGLSPDIYRGYNPIELARTTIGEGLAAQQTSANFFRNDPKPTSGWIKFPGQIKDKDARKALRDQVQDAMSGKNRGKIVVLDQGMEYNALGVTQADSQFLETRHFGVEEIARLFGVPPHRIGHLLRSTNNNIEWQGGEFVTFTMTPWAERWEASIEHDLLPESDQDIEIEFNFKRLLRGDMKTRSAYHKDGIFSGWLTRNEARAAEGMDPIDGLDEPLVPLNMVTPDEAAELQDTNELNEPNEKIK